MTSLSRKPALAYDCFINMQKAISRPDFTRVS